VYSTDVVKQILLDLRNLNNYVVSGEVMLEKATKELRLKLWWIYSVPVSDDHFYKLSEGVTHAVGVELFQNHKGC